MSLPRLLVLSLGGTITMVPDPSGGIAPKLGAGELVASLPALAEVAEIEAQSSSACRAPRSHRHNWSRSHAGSRRDSEP
ncbi:MAG: asparaginase domain-containing protein, partial [Acetobacteraceae bacterium]